MKKLALIHTVNWYNKSVIEPFSNPWQKENTNVEIINIMDDSLLSESLANGGPTPSVTRRMLHYFLAAESMGADAAMCSCTTMGPCTRYARQIVRIPIFNIDEPMAREAVKSGKTLGIIATVRTSAPATRELLEIEAAGQHKVITVKTVINEKAFSYLLDGEIARHNELVYEEIEKLQKSVDVIVLGQVSLSQIKYETKVPMLQVGVSGFNHAGKLLGLS
jgi:Asp/Glu/hydantoin racemase